MASMTLDFPAPVGPVKTKRSVSSNFTFSGVPEGGKPLHLKPQGPHSSSSTSSIEEFQSAPRLPRSRSLSDTVANNSPGDLTDLRVEVDPFAISILHIRFVHHPDVNRVRERLANFVREPRGRLLLDLDPQVCVANGVPLVHQFLAGPSQPSQGSG